MAAKKPAPKTPAKKAAPAPKAKAPAKPTPKAAPKPKAPEQDAFLGYIIAAPQGYVLGQGNGRIYYAKAADLNEKVKPKVWSTEASALSFKRQWRVPGEVHQITDLTPSKLPKLPTPSSKVAERVAARAARINDDEVPTTEAKGKLLKFKARQAEAEPVVKRGVDRAAIEARKKAMGKAPAKQAEPEPVDTEDENDADTTAWLEDLIGWVSDPDDLRAIIRHCHSALNNMGEAIA